MREKYLKLSFGNSDNMAAVSAPYQTRKGLCLRIKTRWCLFVMLFLLVIGVIELVHLMVQNRDVSDENWKLQEFITRFQIESRLLSQRAAAICKEKVVTPRCIYLLNADAQFSTVYSDPAVLSGRCWASDYTRQFLHRSLIYWMKLAAKRNITWWLTSGTLIGAFRHRDLIPYDHDGDVSVSEGLEPEVRKLSNPHTTFHAGLNLRFRPGKFDGERSNCLGHKVLFQMDACSFSQPLARIIQSTDFFFDIFSSKYVNSTHFYPEGGVTKPLRRDIVFPLRLCRFMNLTLPCPRDPVSYLKPTYPDFHMLSKWCLFGLFWI